MDEKNFIIELIEVYKSLPALWQVKSKVYSNKIEKCAQYEILLQKYKEKYPNAGKKELAVRINNLRSAYRREVKRIENCERSGAGVDDESQSCLYYFDAMNFLRDNELPCSTQSSIEDNNESMTIAQGKKRKKTDSTDDLLNLAAKHLERIPDDCEKTGEDIANKLRNMSKEQRLFAEKCIHEILFEGQMGTLHRNVMQLHVSSVRTSALSSPAPFSSSPTLPTFVLGSGGRLTRCSTPRISVTAVPPQIEEEPPSVDECSDNSLTRYFSSFNSSS